MNLANFDNIIAKRNVDRYFKTGNIDINYLIYGTGTDAIEHIIKVYKNEEIKYKEKEVEKDKNITIEGIAEILDRNGVTYTIESSPNHIGQKEILINHTLTKQVKNELFKYENVLIKEFWENTGVLWNTIIELECDVRFPAGYYIFRQDEIETEIDNLEACYNIEEYNIVFNDSNTEYNFEEDDFYYQETKNYLQEVYKELVEEKKDFRNFNLSKEKALKLLKEAGIKK